MKWILSSSVSIKHSLTTRKRSSISKSSSALFFGSLVEYAEKKLNYAAIQQLYSSSTMCVYHINYFITFYDKNDAFLLVREITRVNVFSLISDPKKLPLCLIALWTLCMVALDGIIVRPFSVWYTALMIWLALLPLKNRTACKTYSSLHTAPMACRLACWQVIKRSCPMIIKVMPLSSRKSLLNVVFIIFFPN